MNEHLTREDYGRFPAVEADFRLSYGTETDQFGDLYLPSGDGPHPVVILLHGGCWRSRFGLEPLGRVAETLRQLGMAVWNLEYQRLGQGEVAINDARCSKGADHLRYWQDLSAGSFTSDRSRSFCGRTFELMAGSSISLAQ